jgi:energy-coupling factor transporter ATP-binding protein EcfA2
MIEFRDFEINDLVKIERLTLGEKGLISLCGEIGCGKSSIAKALIRYIGYEGEILFNGIDVDPIRDKISYVPQNLEYYFLTENLYDEVNLMLNLDVNEFQSELSLFNIKHLVNQNFTDLSGGEQVRLAMFINYISKVNCLVLDETLNMNDYKNLLVLEDVVNKLKNEMLVLEIAHDLDRILQADLIVFICENKIKVFNYTSDFLNDDQVRKVWKTDDRI